MFDRLLLSIVVALSMAPANADAQIVIESSDGREIEDEQERPAADDSTETGDAAPTEDDGEDDGKDDEQPDEEGGADAIGDAEPSGVTIEAYGSDDAPQASEEAEEADEATSPDDEAAAAKTLDAGQVRDALQSGIQSRLSDCVAATARPQEHALSGSYVAQPPPDSVVETTRQSLIASPAKLKYSDAMFLSADDAALPDEEVAGLVTERKAEFEACVDEIDVSLPAPPPRGSWKMRFSFQWVASDGAGSLNDVEWSR